MKLTQKLLGYLNRVFDKDPHAVLSLRLGYDGALQWTVDEGILTTVVTGGSGGPLSINLADYTIATLVTLLAAQTGYSVPYETDGDTQHLSALTLLDGTNTLSSTNGDHLNSYTSVLWAWLESMANQLQIASDQIVQALRQMVIGTASDEWLDELGSYYDVLRLTGESDSIYGTRIIASVGRPRGNNVAIEVAINTITNGLTAHITDAAAQAFTVPYSGTSYGLFDVIYSVLLDGSDDLNAYNSRVISIVESFRDAGTHMRSVVVNGLLSDIYNFDGIADDMALSIELDDLSDSAAMNLKKHDGTYRRDGSLVIGGTPGPLITFNNSGDDLMLILTISGVVQPPEDF